MDTGVFVRTEKRKGELSLAFNPGTAKDVKSSSDEKVLPDNCFEQNGKLICYDNDELNEFEPL